MVVYVLAVFNRQIIVYTKYQYMLSSGTLRTQLKFTVRK